MRKTRICIGALLCFSVGVISFLIGRGIGNEPEVGIRWSETQPWIEVYHDGELASEWQPSDGPLYELLNAILDDDIPLYPHPNSQPHFFVKEMRMFLI